VAAHRQRELITRKPYDFFGIPMPAGAVENFRDATHFRLPAMLPKPSSDAVAFFGHSEDAEAGAISSRSEMA